MRRYRLTEQQRALYKRIKASGEPRFETGQIASRSFGPGGATYGVTIANATAATGIAALQGDYGAGKSVMVASIGENASYTMIMGQAPPNRRATENAIVWTLDATGEVLL